MNRRREGGIQRAYVFAFQEETNFEEEGIPSVYFFPFQEETGGLIADDSSHGLTVLTFLLFRPDFQDQTPEF